MDSSTAHTPEIRRQIGDVLLRSWDPLGITRRADAGGAYDAYVGPVCDLLAAGVSDRTVAEHLVRVETAALGYEDSTWRLLVPTTRKLRKLYRRLAVSSRAP